MSGRRIQVQFGPGSRGDYDFARRPPAGSASKPAPLRASADERASPHAPKRTWIDSGIVRGALLVLIVVCGVSAVVWIRDLASAFGVHWLGGG